MSRNSKIPQFSRSLRAVESMPVKWLQITLLCTCDSKYISCPIISIFYINIYQFDDKVHMHIVYIKELFCCIAKQHDLWTFEIYIKKNYEEFDYLKLILLKWK